MFPLVFLSEPSFDAEFQHFLRGKEIVLSGTMVPKVKGLSSEQSEAMVRLSRLPAFKELVDKVQADEVSVSPSVLYASVLHRRASECTMPFCPPAILHVDREQLAGAVRAVPVDRREAVQ